MTINKNQDADYFSRPDRRQDGLDRFKADTDQRLSYREAYLALAQRDPNAIKGLPDPDGKADFDVAEAMKALQGRSTAPVEINAVPKVNLKT